jgi:hypothetical protein
VARDILPATGGRDPRRESNPRSRADGDHDAGARVAERLRLGELRLNLPVSGQNPLALDRCREPVAPGPGRALAVFR